MELEVKILSRENIKPSSPTPSHLKHFNLSLLDHLIPSPYAPIILFYPSHDQSDTTTKRLELLKQSLSETLTQFYPLCGKIKDELSIECNDEGANFVEAKVKCSLAEFLNQPQLTLLQKFIYIEHVSEESNSGTYVTNIQVNFFSCGGIAIGICISHRIIDGAALGTFLKSWKNKAKGCNQLVKPNFVASSLFPTNDLWFKNLSMSMWGSLFKQGKWVTRRFLFRNSDILALKTQISCTTNPTLQHFEPTAKLENRCVATRLEIVSAMLWKSLMEVSKARFGTQRPSLVSHLVNLRKRIDHELCPQHAMGNLLWFVAAEHLSDDNEMVLDELVGKLKRAILKVDSDFVEDLRGDKGRSIMEECMRGVSEKGLKSEVDYFGFSSWCNFEYYEADFGWGKPIWVTSVAPTGSMFMNLIMLNDTLLRDGIEAWVTLDEEDMNHLIPNHELLSFATLDPIPFSMNSVK